MEGGRSGSGGPGDVDRLLEDAALAVERSDWRTAVRLAEDVLSIDASNAEAAGLLALARRRASRAARDPGERRPVTIMFCDLVGSTDYASRLDPEALRDLLRNFHHTATDVLEERGGHIAEFLGDGVLAYFGYPVATEDAPRRAVQAALDLIREAAAGNDGGVRVRIGIHTGLVVIADMGGGGAPRAGSAVGQAPAVAARIQSLAEPGTVYLSEATADLLGEAFELEDLGTHELKGVDRPLSVHRVVRPRRFAAGSRATRRPLVGRDAELARLRAAWEAASTGPPGAVLVVGEAGIGKSRLTAEVASWAHESGGHVVIMRCSPYDTDDALRPVARLLTEMIEWQAGGPPADVTAALVDLLAGAGVRSAADVAAAETLLGLELSPDAPDLSSEAIREHTFSVLLSVLTAIESAGPLLAVMEDAHWADPSTIELVDALRRTGGRILLLATSRRHDVGITDADALEIGPLTTEAREALLDAVGAASGLDDETRRAVLDRSGGVPLFLEELARTVDADGPTAVPASLHSLLLARLDRFRSQREVVQALATVGRPVTASFVESVLRQPGRPAADVPEHLAVLTDGGILQERGLPPAYEFTHALLAETAYESQLLSRRRVVHAAVARELSAEGTTEFGLLARHQQEAGDRAAAAGSWHRAGQKAMSIAAMAEASAHLQRARELMTGLDEADPGLAYAVHRDLAVCLIQHLGYTAPETEDVSAAALALSDAAGSDDVLPALYGLYMGAIVTARYDRADAIAARGLRAARSRGDRSDIVAADSMLAFPQFMRGRLADAETILRRVAETRHERLRFGVASHPPVSSLGVLGCVLVLQGRDREGTEAMDAALQAAAQLGDDRAQFMLAYLHVFASFLHTTAGHLTRGIEHGRIAVEISREHGFASWLGAGMVNASLAAALERPDAERLSTFRAAQDAFHGAGARSFATFRYTGLAMALLQAGDLDGATDAVTDAKEVEMATGEDFYAAERLRVAAAIAGARGQREDARRDLRAAQTVARRQSAGLFEARATAALKEAAA